MPHGKSTPNLFAQQNPDEDYSLTEINKYYKQHGFSPASELQKEINIDMFFKSKYEKVSTYLREEQLRDVLENAKERRKREHKQAKIDTYLQYKEVYSSPAN